MSNEINWGVPLEFKTIGNFLEIMNKKDTFRFLDMVHGNPRNKYTFIPVSYCSDVWRENITSEGKLDYGKVNPLKNKTNGVESDCEYGTVELICDDLSDGGLTVRVNGVSSVVIGEDVQELKGVFLVNTVTGVVLAYCILPETVNVTEYIVFKFVDFLVEINNNHRVLDLSSIFEPEPLDVSFIDYESVVSTGSFNEVVARVTCKGVSVPNLICRLLVDGSEYGDIVRTNGDGEVSFLINLSNVGSVELSLEVVGTDYYSSTVSDSVVVEVVERTVVPASIVLSADKTVIQSGETAVLSALVLDGDGEPCSGVEVSFNSNITNTSYHSITNNRGVATFTYNSSANGDVLFSSNIDELSDSIIIEDCIAHKLEEYITTAPNQQEVNYPIGLEWENQPFICEFDIKVTGSGTSFVLQSGSKNINIGISASNGNYRNIWGAVCTGRFNNNLWSYDTWYTMKVVINGSNFQYWIGDTLVKECNDITPFTDDWSFNHRGWVRNVKVYTKNIKIKPIS